MNKTLLLIGSALSLLMIGLIGIMAVLSCDDYIDEADEDFDDEYPVYTTDED